MTIGTIGCDGHWKDKLDPFSFRNESTEYQCSSIVVIDRIKWWCRIYSSRAHDLNKPLSLYEFHFGTKKKG